MSTQLPSADFAVIGLPYTGVGIEPAPEVVPLIERLPPLENGDCLSAEEFERRYEAMPDLKKAELIHGEVFVGSPVATEHASADGFFGILLGLFAAHFRDVQYLSNATVRFDDKNVVQPDGLLRRIEHGSSKVSADDYCEGPPELITEIATSSVSRDLNTKFKLYSRFGVREYVVWRTQDRVINWFELRDGKYEAQPADERHVFRSRQFPGLWIDAMALLTGDGKRALAVLNEGLASPEHMQFKP